MVTASPDSIDIDIKGYYSALKRRGSLAGLIFLITLGTFAGLATRSPKVYTAEGRILFKGLDETTSLTGVGTEARKLQSLLATQSPLGTEKEMIAAHLSLQRVIEQLELKTEKGKPLTVKALRQKLAVEILGSTDVIQVSYKSKDAKQAQQVVDALMAIYIQDAIARQSEETLNAKAFIAGQLPQVEASLLKAESNLRQFKEANGIVDLSQESTLLAQGIAGLKDKIVGVSAELNGVSGQASQLKDSFQLSFAQTVAISTLSQAPEIRGAMDELSVVERDLAEAQKIYLPNHPKVASLVYKRTVLERTLDSQLQQALGAKVSVPKGLLESRSDRETLLESFIGLESNRLKLSQQLATLQQANSTYANRARLLPQLEATQAQLQRKVEVERTTYQALLQKFQEVQLAEKKATSNADIVQPAILPDAEGSSGAVLILGAGMMLGLLFATLAILMAELRDKSLKTLGDIKGSFAYPLLGVIPAEKPRQRKSRSDLELLQFEAFLENGAASFANEAYWMIQENIRFLSAQSPLKTLVVTSALAQEGKSMVVANLAATMARQGRRVLVIDADLRCPAQQDIWKLGPEPSLSDILRQGRKEFQPQPSPNLENLKVLVAGNPVNNPLGLLASPEMFSLLRATGSYFDYVIIDAPPLLQAADALSLGRMSDGMLLVARPGVINRRYSEIAQELLQKHHQTILGLVVNGVNSGYFPNAQPLSKGRPLQTVRSVDLEVDRETEVTPV
jgi:polysaccharide biosynthesis transport protein